MPLMRIPYTEPLPLPKIFPPSASSLAGAISALSTFLSAPPSPRLKHDAARHGRTVLLTGAGISVASGLADYRGTAGTYTLNKTYRPIYYHEFVASHEARKRYWARSFLGWTNLHRARPNEAHWAVRDLGKLGVVDNVVTQNVDSFHPTAHPSLPTIELHGYLRALVCLTCRNEYSRHAFQTHLSTLNPAWSAFLAEMLASGALTTENPDERRRKGLKTNPDGDVDVPNIDYSTFRYPACPVCLESQNTARGSIDIDKDGAWLPTSQAGVLKPAVIMFGESIPGPVKTAAETAVDAASRMLVLGSSLATYSAWRLVKRARENGLPIGILNIGGVRGEDAFFNDPDLSGEPNAGQLGVRSDLDVGTVLPRVVARLGGERRE